MSFYSDQTLATRYLDPQTYVPKVRASFVLDSSEAAYLPNMRLTFIGANTNAESTYAQLPGAAGGLIRNMRLLDGKTELSSISEFGWWKGFNNQSTTNARAQAIVSNLACAAVGRTINGQTRKIAQNVVLNKANTVAAGSQSAFMDLREVFPILNSVTHLPTSVFPNLRVEIEFNTSGALVNTNNTAAPEFNTLRPVLVVDVIENPTVVANLNKQMGDFSWREIEHDQFVIPAGIGLGAGGAVGATGARVVQPVNVKLNGYNNKIVDRVLIVKEIQDDWSTGAGLDVGFGRWGSAACYNQVVQFRINGSNILARNGMVGDNERLAYMVDTWGDQANYTSSNLYSKTDADAILTHSGSTNPSDWVGQLDYIGCYLGKYINDFQLDYRRMGLQAGAGVNPTSKLLIGHVYAEVRKQFNFLPGGAGYNISYTQE